MNNAYSLLVATQFSVVVFLAIACRQAAQGFAGEKAFSTLSLGWLINLVYLVLTSKFLESTLPHSLLGSDQIADLLASVLFWRAAAIGTPSEKQYLLTKVTTVQLVLIFTAAACWYLYFDNFFDQKKHSNFMLAVLPIVVVAMLARICLARYFRHIENKMIRVSRHPPVLSFGAYLYTFIQPLHFAGNLGDVVGFALGLSAKMLIYFGLTRLLVDYAGAYSRSRDEQVAVERGHKVLRQVGHELGTPVSEILHYTTELGKTIPHKGMTGSLLASIENAALRMAAILDASSFNLDQFFAARGQATLDVRSEPSDRRTLSANTLVHIAVMALKATRTETVRYKLSYSRNCCFQCIPGQIVQVLINILRNAYDSLPGGEGVIQIKTENLRFDESPQGASSIRITVQDNGEGIDSSIRSHIFEVGFSTRGGPNRGQGLPISESLIRRNLGSMDLISPAEKTEGRSGTRVTLTFPRKSCDQE